MQPWKKLFVASAWLPHRGGSRIMYHELLRRLPGGEFTVLTSLDPQAAEFDAKAAYAIKRVRWLPEHGWRAPIAWGSLCAKVCAATLSQKPQIIIAGEPFPAGLACRLACKLSKAKLVSFAHDDPTPEGLRFQSGQAWLAYRNSDIVFAASDYAKERLLAGGVVAEKIILLTPGVDAARFLPAWHKRANRAKPNYNLLTVARLEQTKGIDTVLRALPLILRKLPQLIYNVVGGGPDKARLEALAASLGVAQNVRFLGKVNDEELDAAYAAADLFAMMSRPQPDGGVREGVGIVFLEAMASGLPVIGSRLGGTGHAIRDGVNGFRLQHEDGEAVAESVARLLSDYSLSRAYGEAGRRIAETEFSLDERSRIFHSALEGLENNTCQTHHSLKT